VAVRVGAITEGGRIVGFYVADDGVGIAPDERSDVFDPGFSTAEDGTGFGLTVVDRIVAGHGWTVSVGESAAGGARFEVVDPAETAFSSD
jgi:signal transduction histidine kinase